MRLCDEHKIRATYFELTTALAFLTYKQSQCDAVVLEVGLGGRDDATNVIKNPSLSIITSIQLDHTKVTISTFRILTFTCHTCSVIDSGSRCWVTA